MCDDMIYNQDCLAGMKNLEDNSVDFILTDLPYGLVDYAQDKRINLAEMWQEFKRILKPCCIVALFASSKFTIELAASNLDWYKYKWCWVKNFSTNFVNAKNRPLARYEEILIFSGGKVVHAVQTDNHARYYPQGLKPARVVKNHGGSTICLSAKQHKGDARKKFGGVYHAAPSQSSCVEQVMTNYPIDVLYFDAPYNNRRNHPNEKPVALLEYLIRTYTREGETVLDATMGSGSTGVACMNTNRNFIGYELDEGFYKIAKRRIREAFNNKAQELWSDYDAEKIEASVQI